MPIGTSDGQYFESEFDHRADQPVTIGQEKVKPEDLPEINMKKPTSEPDPKGSHDVIATGGIRGVVDKPIPKVDIPEKKHDYDYDPTAEGRPQELPGLINNSDLDALRAVGKLGEKVSPDFGEHFRKSENVEDFRDNPSLKLAVSSDYWKMMLDRIVTQTPMDRPLNGPDFIPAMTPIAEALGYHSVDRVVGEQLLKKSYEAIKSIQRSIYMSPEYKEKMMKDIHPLAGTKLDLRTEGEKDEEIFKQRNAELGIEMLKGDMKRAKRGEEPRFNK